VCLEPPLFQRCLVAYLAAHCECRLHGCHARIGHLRRQKLPQNDGKAEDASADLSYGFSSMICTHTKGTRGLVL